MFKNRFTCKICDRPMPPRVYEAHLKKSHTPEEVQAQVEKNDQEIEKLREEVAGTGEANLGIVPESATGKQLKSFDWGEVYACASCKQEFPAKAMRWHAKIEHGV